VSAILCRKRKPHPAPDIPGNANHRQVIALGQYPPAGGVVGFGRNVAESAFRSYRTASADGCLQSL
jgi:hypothetical protein